MSEVTRSERPKWKRAAKRAEGLERADRSDADMSGTRPHTAADGSVDLSEEPTEASSSAAGSNDALRGAEARPNAASSREAEEVSKVAAATGAPGARAVSTKAARAQTSGGDGDAAKSAHLRTGVDAALEAQLRAAAMESCEVAGVTLFDFVVRGNRNGLVLTVYIEHDLRIVDGEARSGVAFQHCVDVTRDFSERLVPLEDALPRYRIDVSSPGIERALPAHIDLQAYIGARLEARGVAGDPRACHRGALTDVTMDTLTLALDDGVVTLDRAHILELHTAV